MTIGDFIRQTISDVAFYNSFTSLWELSDAGIERVIKDVEAFCVNQQRDIGQYTLVTSLVYALLKTEGRYDSAQDRAVAILRELEKKSTTPD